jgi:hypothetical protein
MNGSIIEPQGMAEQCGDYDTAYNQQMTVFRLGEICRS